MSVTNEAHMESVISTTNILSMPIQGNNSHSNQHLESPSKKIAKGNGTRKKWQQHYNDLVEYKKINGHCKIPWSYILNPQLATWVSNQRQFYSSRNPHTQKYLSKEKKVALLEAIGLVWNTTDAVPKLIERRTTSKIDGIWDEVKRLHEEGMFWECEMNLNLAESGKNDQVVDVCDETVPQSVKVFPKSHYSDCNTDTWQKLHRLLFYAARQSGFTIAVQKHYCDNGKVMGNKF
jgi:hypothetical protein